MKSSGDLSILIIGTQAMLVEQYVGLFWDPSCVGCINPRLLGIFLGTKMQRQLGLAGLSEQGQKRNFLKCPKAGFALTDCLNGWVYS